MSEKTLFLSWEDHDTPRWFPIGRLDADAEFPLYRFRYTRGAELAQNEVGLPLLPEFPELDKKYESPNLFPIFQNRIMSPRRADFPEYLRALNIPNTATPIDVLAANGGRRATDNFEVFPKIDKQEDGGFTCRFFLRGWRHINKESQEHILKLECGESVYMTLELTNPATRLAVQIQTIDYHMIGWAPRYLVHDISAAMLESLGEYKAWVVQVNPMHVPSNKRVLIEMQGRWDNDHGPMSGPDFQPLVD